MEINLLQLCSKHYQFIIKAIHHLIICILLFTQLAGCVAVPIAVPEEKPFTKYVKENLTVGTTSSNVVKDALGEPVINSENWWIYHDEQVGWRFAGCIFSDDYCGIDEPKDVSTPIFLRIEFDANDMVSDYDILEEDDLCKKYRTCHKFGWFMWATDKSGVTKTPGECVIYIYSKRYLIDSDPVIDIKLNDQSVGVLVSSDGYLIATNPTGIFSISITSMYRSNLFLHAVSNEFTCQDQQTIFVRYESSEGFLGTTKRLELVAESEARDEIKDRWHALGGEWHKLREENEKIIIE